MTHDIAFIMLILTKRSFQFNIYNSTTIFLTLRTIWTVWRKAIHESNYQGPVSVHDFVTKFMSELEISEDKTSRNPLVTVQHVFLKIKQNLLCWRHEPKQFHNFQIDYYVSVIFNCLSSFCFAKNIATTHVWVTNDVSSNRIYYYTLKCIHKQYIILDKQLNYFLIFFMSVLRTVQKLLRSHTVKVLDLFLKKKWSVEIKAK